LSDHSGAWLPCPCGAQARYGGRRPKTFTTVLGEMRLLRAYYHCEECNKGFFPRDMALGMEDGCKLAIGTRLKRAGMHWSVRGADAIIALRCSKLSGRCEDFWERRAERANICSATVTTGT
jgi:hypothetical protein